MSCPLGYTPDDLATELGDEAESFLEWLGPVPPTICSAALSACSPPHGLVVDKSLVDQWREADDDHYWFEDVPEDYNEVVAERDRLAAEVARLHAVLDEAGIVDVLGPRPDEPTFADEWGSQ